MNKLKFYKNINIDTDVEVEVEVEIDTDEIINKLYTLDDIDLKKIHDELKNISSNLFFKDNCIIIAENLLEEQKIEILKDLMELNISKLEEIRKTYVK